MRFAPTITWDPKVSSYLEHTFGTPKLQKISESLCKPSLRTCLRVNTRLITPQAVAQQLQQLFPTTQPYVHPLIDTAVIVPGRGPLLPEYQLCGEREVLVNRIAGESVLKGANVFAPGLLAATPGIAEGDLVAVSVALEQPGGVWCGVNRGMSLTGDLKQRLAHHQDLYIGVGRVTAGRRGLFRSQEGLAVEIIRRVFEIPPCNGLLRGQVMLQALPSIVAAQALSPEPGSRVLDMCAAPGGKTSMLAQMMGDTGAVIALDRTQAKVEQIQSLAADWGLSCVQAYVADGTQLYQQNKQQQQPKREKVQEQQFTQAACNSSCQSPVGCEASTAANDDSCSPSNSTQSIDSTIAESTTSDNSSRRHNSAGPSSTDDSRGSRSKRRRMEFSVQDGGIGGLSSGVAAVVQPASFDYVLLDAPCSALGLRPRLSVDWTLPTLEKLAAYQRALLHSAVHMLKPGGNLVYCTCTINPGENEANVRYVLDKWPNMKLVEQPVRLGGPGLIGDGLLSAAEAALVQRFDPIAGVGDDTIGFFVAKFVKKDFIMSNRDDLGVGMDPSANPSTAGYGKQRFIGSIASVRKSFGFIKSAAFASEVFFHSSACVHEDLATGEAVEFELESDQHAGKKVAARVWRSKQPHQLRHISTSTHYGCISSYQASGQHGSGFLRFMDQQGKVQHLTFSSQDLLTPCSTTSLASGSLVTFKVLVDERQKALAGATGAAGPPAVHAYMRATQIEPLSDTSKAALDSAIQQQLTVLQAVSEVFDRPTQQ